MRGGKDADVGLIQVEGWWYLGSKAFIAASTSANTWWMEAEEGDPVDGPELPQLAALTSGW